MLSLKSFILFSQNEPSVSGVSLRLQSKQLKQNTKCLTIKTDQETSDSYIHFKIEEGTVFEDCKKGALLHSFMKIYIEQML